MYNDEFWDYLMKQEDIFSEENDKLNKIEDITEIENMIFQEEGSVFSSKDVGVYINEKNKGVLSELIMAIHLTEPADKDSFRVALRYYMWVYVAREYLYSTMFHLNVLTPNIVKNISEYMEKLQSEYYKRTRIRSITAPDMKPMSNVNLDKSEVTSKKKFATQPSFDVGHKTTFQHKKWLAFFIRMITPITVFGKKSKKAKEMAKTAINILQLISDEDKFSNQLKKSFLNDIKRFSKGIFNAVNRVFSKITDSVSDIITYFVGKTKENYDSSIFNPLIDSYDKLLKYSDNEENKFRSVLYIDQNVIDNYPDLLENLSKIMESGLWNKLLNKTEFFFDIIVDLPENENYIVMITKKMKDKGSYIPEVPIEIKKSNAHKLFKMESAELDEYDRLIEYINKYSDPIRRNPF